MSITIKACFTTAQSPSPHPPHLSLTLILFPSITMTTTPKLPTPETLRNLPWPESLWVCPVDSQTKLVRHRECSPVGSVHTTLSLVLCSCPPIVLEPS